MPMSWTPENDRMLFLKVLEVHNFQVDGDKIAKAWPGNPGAGPTPRAIKERIVRLKQMAGVKPSSKSGPTTPASAKPTPVKPTATRVAKTPTSSAKKRKVDDESDGDHHMTDNDTPLKGKSVQRGRTAERSNTASQRKDRGSSKFEVSNNSFNAAGKPQSIMSQLVAQVEDPFEARMSQPVFTTSKQSGAKKIKEFTASVSPFDGEATDVREPRARSARQASRQASVALRRAGEDDDPSSEDSAGSMFQQSELDPEI